MIPTLNIGWEEVRALGYHSQIGQDLFVDRLLDRQRGGVFVDVGAHDGVTFSNSLFFDRERGWSGVCIEPNPDVFPRLCANRPDAMCVPAAVGPVAGTASFRVIDGDLSLLAGLEAEYEPAHRERIAREMAAVGVSSRLVEVPVRRLDDLLVGHGVTRVDFLSVDVEGAEVGVVESIDLAAFGVRVAVVENNYGSEAIREAFEVQGYELVCRLSWDDVYLPMGSGVSGQHLLEAWWRGSK